MSQPVEGAEEPEEPHGPQQVVRAEGGFAYGVIGADIHVFGDGMPLYLLENLHPVPETDSQWLREQPSRMLNSRFAVVGFTSRADELAQLHQWRETGPRLAARWLHGPGGQGKSRLAAQFAAESAAAGWKVVTATHGPGSVIPPPGSQNMRLDNTAGLLMIVDYADRWPQTHLTWLLSNALLHQSAVRTRVLLLARTADLWPALRATLTNQQAGISTQFLQPLSTDGSGQRAAMFEAARDSFASRYGVGTPADIAPPGPLDAPDFGLTLAVHMAALVAVDAHVHGRRPPADMAGLTVYLLDREHAHWARLYGDRTHELNPTERTYFTPPSVMNQAVFIAALTGALQDSTGREVLSAFRLQLAPEQVIADHSICYPPAGPARESVLEPLYPDRLAEDFLALTLPGHTADYPVQTWAAPTATALLTRDSDLTPAAWTPRTITFLAAAAERWDHLGPGYLYPLLREDPQLALDAGSAALTSLARLDDIDPALLKAIEARFPPGRHADLDAGAAVVVYRLAHHRLANTQDAYEHARVRENLAKRLHYAGLHEEAATAAQDALPACRHLVKANRAHEPGLASMLNSVGIYLSEAGRSEEALTPAREAVAIRRRLAQTKPGAHQHENLAMALMSLGSWLSEVGRAEEALACTREAVAIHRRLSDADPAVHQYTLAGLLGNFGIDLSENGQRDEAVAVTQEAVTLFRRLAGTDPVAHQYSLALVLTNLGARLSEVGRHGEALAPAQEAVDLFRPLAKANPAAYEPGLAGALTNLGNRLTAVGQQGAADAARQEAAAIRSRARQRSGQGVGH
ncbi:tetratricopeptide repeat protein [Streptomyces sp. HYC2]|uniref:tetratricopeptide repeat protein n=1 Tax=Streptomyces sp. HYC2 TaxID=2955207 RepID=UPI0024801435|nr:tetratricopeptide repeat protein [Streptomyces sp. HYC2]